MVNGYAPKQLQEQINKKLGLISDFYLTDYKKDRDQQFIGLLSGRSGSILLQSLLYIYTNDVRFKNEIEENCNFILEELNNSEEISVGYANGISGVGWIFQYLQNNGLQPYDFTEILSEIDSVLKRELDLFLKNKEFDLLHESLGLGLYFIKRGKKSQVEKIINAISLSITKNNEEILFSRFDKYASKVNVYDYGLAHGMGGILYFLGKCYQKGIKRRQCLTLIKGFFNFYINNIQDQYEEASYYPDSIPVNSYTSGRNKPHKSRVAWCYGDLGILNSIYFVSSVVNDTEINTRALNMLKYIASRRGFENTIVSEASFCHGSSGNGLIFFNLYLRTNEKIFLDAFNYYLSLTNDYGEITSDVIDSFVNPNHRIGELQRTGILTGLGGPLLIFINSRYGNENLIWNEAFFLN